MRLRYLRTPVLQALRPGVRVCYWPTHFEASVRSAQSTLAALAAGERAVGRRRFAPRAFALVVSTRASSIPQTFWR